MMIKIISKKLDLEIKKLSMTVLMMLISEKSLILKNKIVEIQLNKFHFIKIN